MKRSQTFFGVLVFLLFAGLISGLFLIEPPAGAREPLLILVGAVAAAFGAIVQYLFGSSSGSAQKTELLANRAGQ